jgi:ABC-2 type transport system permease protein
VSTHAVTAGNPVVGSPIAKGHVDVHPVSQIRVIRSEWTKLRSIRSTVWSLLAAFVIVVAIGILVSVARAGHLDRESRGDLLSFDATSTSLVGVFLAQLAIGVLGVLLMTSEYATGMIRVTFAAVPRRLPVLWAKSVVFAITAFVIMLVAAFIAFLGGQAAFKGKTINGHGIQASLSQPGVLRAVIGAALYLTVVGLLGIALGSLIRNTAGAIATLFGVLLILPIIVNFLPSNWNDAVSKYLPGNAGQAITNVVRDHNSLSPWAGFAVFCGYTIIFMIAAAVMLKRRDA